MNLKKFTHSSLFVVLATVATLFAVAYYNGCNTGTISTPETELEDTVDIDNDTFVEVDTATVGCVNGDF